MDIIIMSEPTVLGRVSEIGEIQESLQVFLKDGFHLRGDPGFQEFLRISISLKLGLHVSEIRIAGLSEHLTRDGIKFIVSNAVFSRLTRRIDGILCFGNIVIAAVDGYTRQRDNTS